VAHDELFETIASLLDRHSPSGLEGEMDDLLRERLAGLGELNEDAAGNLVLRVAGREDGPLRAVLAHKDEIGAIVKRIEDDGRLIAESVGDAHPWIWGEGPVDVLGRHGSAVGVLSFGARHISEESPQHTQRDKEPVRWRTAWIETKLPDAELERLGIEPGSRIVPARSRKQPVRLGAEGECVAGHALDDKAAVAGVLALAARLKPRYATELVFTAREEVGCHGSQFYARHTAAEALVALEVIPVAAEYDLPQSADPVLIRADARGPLDDGLSLELDEAARGLGLTMRQVVVSRYGSDASTSLMHGLVPRSACLGFATENTHGYEIAHLGAIAACVDVLDRWLS
jgi:putative aminopeptidase FrvX